jgi:hypothetical protein
MVVELDRRLFLGFPVNVLRPDVDIELAFDADGVVLGGELLVAFDQAVLKDDKSGAVVGLGFP